MCRSCRELYVSIPSFSRSFETPYSTAPDISDKYRAGNNGFSAAYLILLICRSCLLSQELKGCPVVALHLVTDLPRADDSKIAVVPVDGFAFSG